MPRRIIIHGGFHKTGTSSVQNTLRDNRVAMKKQIALRLRWHMKDLIAAAHSYSNGRDPTALAEVQAHFETLMTALPGMPRRTLILSAPELAGHLPGRPGLEDYAAAPVLFYAYWELAKKHYPAADIQFYLTTRAPEAWLASVYGQHVASSDMSLGLGAYRAQYTRTSDLAGMVAEIASRVPAPVHHCALEDCKELPLGPAGPLLDLCKLPTAMQATLAPAAPDDKRDAPEVLLALLDANRTYADPKARQAAKDAIQREARGS